MKAAISGGTTRTFTHDAARNVTYDNRSGAGYGYTYDAANRMESFSINGVVQAEYKYNYLGQQAIRTLTQTGQVINSIYGPDGNRMAEFDFDPVSKVSTLLREYVWFEGAPVAVIEGGVVYYVRSDHIGKPVFATDATGTKVWEATYLPFGGVHTSSGANINLRFPGQWFQSESGLHQNWMRDYDPTTGRYIQADPLGLVDGASVYGYVRQNPNKYIDPRGENIRTNLVCLAGLYMKDTALLLFCRPPPKRTASCPTTADPDLFLPPLISETKGHTGNKRPSNKPKHEAGDTRRGTDQGGEKGDETRRPIRKRPPNHKGPWPVRPSN